MNPLERRRSDSASQSSNPREKSAGVRGRGRRPVLEDLELRRLLSGISVFPVGTADVSPSDITSGPDGTIWFTEAMGDAIGMINPTTHAVTQFPLPSNVGFINGDQVSITAGPDGNLWFADSRSNTIGMINPTSDAISVFPVPTPNAAIQDITTGPDGNIWFTEQGANKVGVINPTTGAITEFPVPIPVVTFLTPNTDWMADTGLDDIAAGPDGNLWFTQRGAIGKINPTTGAITEYPLSTSTRSIHSTDIRAANSLSKSATSCTGRSLSSGHCRGGTAVIIPG